MFYQMDGNDAHSGKITNFAASFNNEPLNEENVDLFDRLKMTESPLGKYSSVSHGYFMFPKLEGPISNKMTFRGKEVLCWSINNYLGLANHPEVRKIDEEASREWGLSYPMGARMMSGNTRHHEELEAMLSDYVKKEDTILFNYGYQGMHSAIDALTGRQDVIVYDSDAHACITDGVRLHQGKRFVYPHNNIEKLETCLQRAKKITDETKGGILVITEGVFGMVGDQGRISDIVALKEKYEFRLLVDDAHGIGTMGDDGSGTGTAQGVQDQIDLYFGTFAKSFASIGAFMSGPEKIIHYLRYNTRSQIFAKSLPMPLVIGAKKRLEMMRDDPSHRNKLWHIATRLQEGLKKDGINLGPTNTCVTPVMLSGTTVEAANIVFDLRESHDLFCSMVVYPVVPKGIILLRLIPTAIHTDDDVDYTTKVFNEIKTKLDAGGYNKENIVNVYAGRK